MIKITALVDYKGFFGSRYDAFPYRSGMDKEKLNSYLSELGYEIEFKPFADIDFNEDIRNRVFLYTSQEDKGLYYKSFIEDIVLGLEENGATVIPKYKFLKANNNKVFMEILRDVLFKNNLPKAKTKVFGTIDELLKTIDSVSFPIVVKGASGSMSKNVFLANNKEELIKRLNKLSKTYSIKDFLKEKVREYKHKGYKQESLFRNKFIIQEFIPNLKNDWKVYVYGEKYYIFYRPILKHRGFRASGGGYDNYYYGEEANIPDGIFDFAKKIYDLLDVPNASLDICYDGKNFYLLEFQCVYFGTAGILKKYSKEFYELKEGSWIRKQNLGDIEKVYVESIVHYLKSKQS